MFEDAGNGFAIAVTSAEEPISSSFIDIDEAADRDSRWMV